MLSERVISHVNGLSHEELKANYSRLASESLMPMWQTLLAAADEITVEALRLGHVEDVDGLKRNGAQRRLIETLQMITIRLNTPPPAELTIEEQALVESKNMTA